jgi:hypothetical protein
MEKFEIRNLTVVLEIIMGGLSRFARLKSEGFGPALAARICFGAAGLGLWFRISNFGFRV